MKKSIIAFFSLLLLYSCNKEESKTNLQLTGTIKGLKKGTLYIQRVVDTSLVAIDTIVIDGTSTFETNLKLDSPEMLYLFLDRGVTNSMDNNILFFAEPGKINIDTNLDSYIVSAKITGSKNQEKYEEYQKINTRFRDENLDMIEQKFNALKSNNSKILDSLSAKQDNNTKRKYLFATNFAINNRDYEVAPYIALSEIYDINLKYLDTIQKSMSTKVAKSLYGKKLTDYVAKIKKQQ
jgi:anion-transporting  ArsA/GET3 family ATPase